MRNREGYFVGKTERECTSCGALFKKTSKTVTLCNHCNSKRVKGESPAVRMYRRAKGRAAEKGLEFTIQKEDVVIPDTCSILGIALKAHSGRSGGEKNSPALDRIDNSKGYTKENIQVISHLANVMKASASPEELIVFANWVKKTWGETSESPRT